MTTRCADDLDTEWTKILRMAAELFPNHEYNRNRWILAKAKAVRRARIPGNPKVKISSACAQVACKTPRTQDEGHIRPIIIRDLDEPDAGMFADLVNAIRRLFHPTEVYF